MNGIKLPIEEGDLFISSTHLKGEIMGIITIGLVLANNIFAIHGVKFTINSGAARAYIHWSGGRFDTLKRLFFRFSAVWGGAFDRPTPLKSRF